MATKYKQPLDNLIIDKNPKMMCQNPGCRRSGQRLTISDFYKSRNLSISHHPFCKECVDEMVTAEDLETVYEILKVLDTPFIRDIWDEVVKSGTTNCFKEYIVAINSLEHKECRGKSFEDSVFLTAKEAEEKIEAEKVIWYDEWQGYYTKSDMKYLQDYYDGLNNDFKIITTNHKDYAKKIAQASLSQMKAYQRMLDGEEGADAAYEKATKIFDMLSKSAQFAESQRGANDVTLGCFGRVFDAVEKHNWVPEHIPDDEDMYDKLLKQFANIERSLK